MTTVFVTIFFALVGAAYGSFLAAWLYRFGVEKSIVNGRSACVSCASVLTWYELIPLVSFVVLRGSCRRCGSRLSTKYFFVESTSAVVFLITALVLFRGDQYLWLAMLGSVIVLGILLLIFFFELYYGIVWGMIVFVGALILGVLNVWLGMPILEVIYGVLLGAGFFFAQWWLSNGTWVGEGDIWIGVFLGALLGWKLTILALIIAYVSGACVAIVLLLLKKATRKTAIHFGTFLSVAAWVAWLYGGAILEWYMNLLV